MIVLIFLTITTSRDLSPCVGLI